MSKRSKIMITFSGALLMLLYVTPIWMIDLQAPQYPEGMGLYIWIDRITGQKPADLRTINGLNHYIGMKVITPEDIPELKIMPWLVGGLIVLSGLVVWRGNRTFLTIWLALFLILLVAGLVDFYLWEYDYGHNLDPHAPIKVPGMTYQPPLIGVKQLLNMRTLSLPYFGGIAAGLSFLIGLSALVYEIVLQRRSRKNHHETARLESFVAA